MLQSILDWCTEVVLPAEIAGKDILEVGSLNVNGSFRPYIESLGPKSYRGIDKQYGPGVDVIGSAESLIKLYGNDRFDVVISTEMLEHAHWWQAAVYNMMAVTKTGGIHLISTRSEGFPIHPYPEDWWRFSLDDIRAIYENWYITDSRTDPEMPGVFLKAIKPSNWASMDFSHIQNMTVYRQPQ